MGTLRKCTSRRGTRNINDEKDHGIGTQNKLAVRKLCNIEDIVDFLALRLQTNIGSSPG